MKSKYNEFYNLEREPIATLCLCNFGGLAVFDIVHGFDEYVIVGDYYDKPENIRKHKVYTTFRGRDYFVRFGQRYYLDEFMRVDFFGGKKYEKIN